MVFCSFSFGADDDIDCFWYGLAATFLFAYGLFAAAALLLKEEEDIIAMAAPRPTTNTSIDFIISPQ